jgi:hypothetical protein
MGAAPQQMQPQRSMPCSTPLLVRSIPPQLQAPDSSSRAPTASKKEEARKKTNGKKSAVQELPRRVVDTSCSRSLKAASAVACSDAGACLKQQRVRARQRRWRLTSFASVASSRAYFPASSGSSSTEGSPARQRAHTCMGLVGFYFTQSFVRSMAGLGTWQCKSRKQEE